MSKDIWNIAVKTAGIRSAGWPAGRGAPCCINNKSLQAPAWWTSHMGITIYHIITLYSQSLHTPQDSHRCRWLMYSPKSSASCRSRASAPSTGTGTAPGSWPVSWSYPCSPPRRWNPEGSSPWCPPGRLGMWEEVVSVLVVGCGHRGTSVRKVLRTASAPAAAPMKAFWSLSSYPGCDVLSPKRSVCSKKKKTSRQMELIKETTVLHGLKDATALPETKKFDIN